MKPYTKVAKLSIRGLYTPYQTITNNKPTTTNPTDFCFQMLVNSTEKRLAVANDQFAIYILYFPTTIRITGTMSP